MDFDPNDNIRKIAFDEYFTLVYRSFGQRGLFLTQKKRIDRDVSTVIVM